MPRRSMFCFRRFACETERKLNGPSPLRRAIILSTIIAAILIAAPIGAFAQPEPSSVPAGATRAAETQAAPEKAAAAETAEGTEHEEGVLPVVARLVNFLILVGTLVYLLRSPIAGYLNDRGTQI